MVLPNTPVVNPGLKYVNGLNLAKTAAKTLSLSTGAARDSLNVNDIVLSTAVTINGAVVGANGVDVAAIVLNSTYAVYAIGSSNSTYTSSDQLGGGPSPNPLGPSSPTPPADPYPAAGLLSLSATAPTLPFGYDMFRRIGWVRTDGSANILQFWQYGEGQSRQYYYDVGISELSGGSATSFTEIDLATSVPAIATNVMFDITFTPDGATEVAEFLPFGSSATSGFIRYGTGVAGAQVGSITVPCALDSGVPKIQYKVASGDTLTLLCTGYEDYLT